MSTSLDTISVQLKNLDKKVDKINGSVADQNKRLYAIEKDFEVHEKEVNLLKSVLIRVFAPLIIGVIISGITFFFSS